MSGGIDLHIYMGVSGAEVVEGDFHPSNSEDSEVGNH